MKQKKENAPRPGGAGRKPKADPAVFRYSVSFNAIDHARFLALFDQSGMRTKAHFITARIFGEPFKVIKIDKAAVEYYTRLTALYSQYRGIAVNYNQVVKALNANFSEKKALAFLYKLEKATMELADLNRQIIELTREFETRWLQR
ncbi:hypothetical protein C799_02911 [Bacteroides thetaiotaomicron dnLKV9]|uniref:MobA protein n=1 Tax=Bacteroides thetaiotaomicron dnLKV9 TaxID=1235785 RepID=R9HAH7_BACT4|nr:conjugal transfer protein MobA [Bacteroides thetaiotaomicron]EOS01058.1 hypothetical protein C799_02911 [Bacteroides thetaiotaomicron dnLKV9]